MHKEVYQDIQKILESKLGNFYYKAKLGKDQGPEPEDFKIEGPRGSSLLSSLGMLGSLINLIANNDRKFIAAVKSLSDSNDAAIVDIIDQVMPLSLLIKSEEYRKKTYSALYKKEQKKHERKKEKELKKDREAIERVKVIDPAIDKERLEAKSRERIENLKPSNTLFTLKRIQKEGLLYVEPGGRKSTKGLQSLKNFILRVYEISKENSNLTDNAIHNQIAKILNFLEINKEFTRQDIQGYIERISQIIQSKITN